MVKKMPRTAGSTAKADVVTRVSAEAVNHRAYSLFQARGGEHGHDVQDWFEAKTELLNGHHAGIAAPVAEPQRRVR